MSQEEINKFILTLDGVTVGRPFDPKIEVFSVNNKMFALLYDQSTPVKLSLRCDPLLAKVLRQRYDEVMPGQKLNQKYWNTLLLTGQLTKEEIKDLIRLSFNLVANN